MRRGDLVSAAAPGDYGKPRPAVVVQSDALDAADSVLVALLTSDLRPAPYYRLDLQPSAANGLKAPSQVMVDKLIAYPRAKCGPSFGRLSPDELLTLNALLAVMLGLAD